MQSINLSIKEELSSLLSSAKNHYIEYFDNLKLSITYLLFGIVGVISCVAMLTIYTLIMVSVTIIAFPVMFIKNKLKKD